MEKVKFRGIVHIKDDGEPMIRQQNRDVAIMQKIASLKAPRPSVKDEKERPTVVMHSIMLNKCDLLLAQSNADTLREEMKSNAGKHIWVEVFAA